MRRSTLMSSGHLLQFIRSGEIDTRPDAARITGLSRTAVSQRLDDLLEIGLIEEHAPSSSTGGRPPTRIRFRSEAGVVLVADFGVTHCRLGVSHLDGRIVAELTAVQPIALGPDVVLKWAAERWNGLLAELDLSGADVSGIGVGLPGPVEFSAGRAVNPPIMPGWDGVIVGDHLRTYFNAPVFVDNDVNIMAIGEYETYWADQIDDLLFIKISSGIGSGIIANGSIHRGAQGAAGDIGHIRADGFESAVCRCSNTGCVEAIASGSAIAQQLTDLGHVCPDAWAVAPLVLAGNADAGRLVRDAGRAIGAVVSGLVNAFNPGAIIVGGAVASSHVPLLAGMREVIYQRSTALATQQLKLEISRLGERAGATGAVVMVLDQILSPDSIDATVVALRSQERSA